MAPPCSGRYCLPYSRISRETTGLFQALQASGCNRAAWPQLYGISVDVFPLAELARLPVSGDLTTHGRQALTGEVSRCSRLPPSGGDSTDPDAGHKLHPRRRVTDSGPCYGRRRKGCRWSRQGFESLSEYMRVAGMDFCDRIIDAACTMRRELSPPSCALRRLGGRSPFSRGNFVRFGYSSYGDGQDLCQHPPHGKTARRISQDRPGGCVRRRWWRRGRRASSGRAG